MYKEEAKELLNWILLYYDRFIVIMVTIVIIYLFFAEKSSRVKIIYPIVLVFVCVLNPILYHYVLKKIIYWRVFWLLPESIIIGYGLAHLVKSVKPTVVKVAVLIIMVAVLIAGGNNVYKVADFEQTKNQQKVATETKTVGDIMLSIDKNPKCIVPEELAWEMRVYSGDIELLYGRNAEGYINYPDAVAEKVCNELYKEVPNTDFVFGTAYNKKIDFVVLPREKSINDDIAASYGYYMVDAVDGYPIYHN
ncbi:MAG: hypothetical protein J6A59_04805, partial [Lachnospiraceae bacterium]|nr:hypothetical protein [Lachnospiraceae bacterium]